MDIPSTGVVGRVVQEHERKRSKSLEKLGGSVVLYAGVFRRATSCISFPFVSGVSHLDRLCMTLRAVAAGDFSFPIDGPFLFLQARGRGCTI